MVVECQNCVFEGWNLGKHVLVPPLLRAAYARGDAVAKLLPRKPLGEH